MTTSAAGRFVPVRHNGQITVLDTSSSRLIEPAYVAPDWGYAEQMAETLNAATVRKAVA